MKSIKFFILCVCIFLTQIFAFADQVVEPPQNMPETLEESFLSEATIPVNTSKKITAEELILPLALMPYLEYYIDTEAKMNITSVSDAAIVSTFAPYQSLYLPNTQGLVWLRFAFDAIASTEDSKLFVIDLGDTVQGNAKAWYKENQGENISNIITTPNSYAKNNALMLSVQKNNNIILKNIPYQKENSEENSEKEEDVNTTNVPLPVENKEINEISLENGGYVYIAIEGLPSLWFAPFLETYEDAEKNIYLENPKYIVFLGIFILSFLCLIRSALEKSSWRFWSALFGFSALAVAYYGIPLTPAGHIIPANLQGIFALAGTLFSLILLGRYCMSLLIYAPKTDFIFLVLSLLGILIALCPFVPSFSWIVRYINLWPLLCSILLLPTFYLMLKSIKASARYFLVLLILLITEIIALLGVGGTTKTDIWTLIPHIGLLLSLLILFMSPRIIYNSENQDERKNIRANGKSKNQTGDFKINTSANDYSEGSTVVGEPVTITKNKLDMGEEKSSNKNSFNLNIDKENTIEEKTTTKQTIIAQNQEAVGEVQNRTDASSDIWYEEIDFNSPQVFARIEQAFRVPLDSFMHQVYFIEQQLDSITDPEQKAKIADHVQKVLSIGKDISTISTSLPKLVLNKPLQSKVKIAFNLQEILKQVYEKIRYEASAKQIALSWFCSPHLGLWYVGEKDALASLLYQLLSDSIRATKKGLVYVHVKRDETSNNYGRLKFIIGDSGIGQPPVSRSSSLLSKIWEITSTHHGEFKVETTEQGIEYSFVLAFTALEDDGETEKRIPLNEKELQNHKEISKDLYREPSLILVVAKESSQRYLLSFKLEKIPCHVFEAMTLEECYNQYTSSPCGIIILDANLSGNQVSEFIAKLRAFEGEHSLAHCIIVSLYKDRTHAEYLLRIGSDYILDQNIRRMNFREKIQEYLEEAKNPQFLSAKGTKEEELKLIQESIKSNEDKKEELHLNFNEENKSKVHLSMLPTNEEDKENGKSITNIIIQEDPNIKELDNFYPNYNKVVPLPSIKDALLENTNKKSEISLTEEMVSYETFIDEKEEIEEKKKYEKLEF